MRPPIVSGCAWSRSVRHRTYVYSEYCNTALRPMNQAEKDRIHRLCSEIAVEQDRQKFLELVQELNRVLEAKERRMEKQERESEED